MHQGEYRLVGAEIAINLFFFNGWKLQQPPFVIMIHTYLSQFIKGRQMSHYVMVSLWRESLLTNTIVKRIWCYIKKKASKQLREASFFL